MKPYHLYLRTWKGGRGRCIGSFRRYKELVAEAQRRAKLAGYAKSNWGIIFDWNLG